LQLHRYVGLALAAILILMGASGALLAFYEEIDGFFNDGMLVALPGLMRSRSLGNLVRARRKSCSHRLHDPSANRTIHRDHAAHFRSFRGVICVCHLSTTRSSDARLAELKTYTRNSRQSMSLHPRTGELVHFAPPGGEAAGDTLTAGSWPCTTHWRKRL